MKNIHIVAFKHLSAFFMGTYMLIQLSINPMQRCCIASNARVVIVDGRQISCVDVCSTVFHRMWSFSQWLPWTGVTVFICFLKWSFGSIKCCNNISQREHSLVAHRVEIRMSFPIFVHLPWHKVCPVSISHRHTINGSRFVGSRDV